MKRLKQTVAVLMVISMLCSLGSCTTNRRKGADRQNSPDASKREFIETESTVPTDVPVITDVATPTAAPVTTDYPDSEIVDFTMFIGMTGKETDENNKIKELIAKKTGVRVSETWLTNQQESEAVSAILASGKLPDFINTGEFKDLYEGGHLVAWDEYLVKYPNLKELYSDEEWEKFRQDDGHIYWANTFNRFYQKDTSTTTSGQAFWIQARVLEAYGYPKIETLDQYFDLLEKFAKEHPTLPNGTKVIPYTCICEDWRIFGLEAPPMYLDGYPNNGCVGVNLDGGVNNPKVVDYNMSDTAKAYFKKLNEEYQKGNMYSGFAEQKYDDYINMLGTGAVLGICDQYWDFGYSMQFFFHNEQKGPSGTMIPSEIGCDYVPLGLVMKPGGKQQWYSSEPGINNASGIAVTTSCADPDRAFKFMNDILSQEVHDLRFWGIEGEDYLVDENGMFYRTPEMRSKWNDDRYLASQACTYLYMPQWRGISRDGKNCMMPEEQGSEYMATLPEPVAKCFQAYGVTNYVEMIGSDTSSRGPWFPLWDWSNSLSSNTDYGKAWKDMGNCKQKWLPEVVKAKDFDKAWNDYVSAYNDCNPKVFLNEAQQEIKRRMG